MEIVVAEMEHAENQHFGVLRDLGGEPRLAERQFHLSGAFEPVVLVFHRVRVNARVIGVALKQRIHGIVRAQLQQVHARGLDELFENTRAVAVLRKIALGRRELPHQARFDGLPKKFSGQLGHAGGILHDLHRLQT